MIEQNFKAGENMLMLAKTIQAEKYYDDMMKMVIAYPEYSAVIRYLFFAPESLKKHFKVGFLQRLVRLRWKLYQWLGVLQPKNIELRKKLL